MNKKRTVSLLTIPVALLTLSTAIAQEEEPPPYVVPVDTFTCSYNDGKGPADLDKAAAAWNKWADEQGVEDYAAMIVTPYYYGAGAFDVGWLGYWTSQEAMGVGIDAYLAEGGETAKGFSEAVSCKTHEHYASIQVKAPPEGEAPDNIVLMFSNCTRSDDVEWDDLFTRIGKAVEYMEAQGIESGAWMMWPVFGGEGDPGWDFKWVTGYDNYTAFGKAYQHNANGGGRKALNAIMEEAMECDTARVYNAKTVRRITAEMEE